eukprot:sb/3476637/
MFESEGHNFKYSKKDLALADFEKFLKETQKHYDITPSQKEDISPQRRVYILGNRISGRTASRAEKRISVMEFCNLLYSRENDVVNRKKKDKLSYPLNYYWINSSHNTYLMGITVT